MNKSDLIKNSPYYDGYDPSKNYSHLLAVPGRVAQAREFTEIQSTIYDNLSRVADTLFKDGDIIRGCTPSVVATEDSSQPYCVKIDEGYIYLNGLIRRVSPQELFIKGVGKEIIYIDLIEEIVTAAQDESLKDPAVGNENANMIGMDRLKYQVVFSLQETGTSYPIFEFNDGVLFVEPATDKWAEVREILAKRTFDESGNYKVNGLVLSEMPVRQRVNPDGGKIVANLSAGLAYVAGYDVTKPVTSFPEFKLALDTASMLNESKLVREGVSTYEFQNSPIAVLKEVRAEFLRNHYAISRGSGQADSLKAPYDTITELKKVYRGSTVYESGVDYILDNGAIRWLSNNAPQNQEQYLVDFQYLRLINRNDLDEIFDMTPDNSVSIYCSISTIDGHSYFTYNYTGKMETSAGQKTAAEISADPSITIYDDLTKPVTGTYLRFEYEYYLGRMDILCLDSSGGIPIIEGISSSESALSYPSHIPSDLLPLALVYVYPDSERILITNLATKRLSMRDLAVLEKRVSNLEYNIAITDLDREAVEFGSATDLVGVFTDGFIGFSKSDTAYEDASNPGVSAYSVEMLQREGAIKVADTLYVSDIANYANPNIYDDGSSLSLLPSISKPIVSQKKRTGVININPYLAYAKFCPIKLTPSEDYWVSNEIIVNGDGSGISSMPRTIIEVNGDPQMSSMHDQYLIEAGKTSSSTSTSTSTNGWWVTTTTTTTTVSAETVDTISTFMRSRRVDVHADGFSPNTPSIKAKLGNVDVPLLPKEGFDTLAGLNNTVQADSNGSVDAYFIVPENQILSGTAEFELSAAAEEDGSGSTPYSSRGLSRTVTYTYTTTSSVIRDTIRNPDPIAQSFYIASPVTLSGVDLYLSTKDNKLPLIVRILGITNGYPNAEVYYEKYISASSVKVPDSETSEMVATHVDFDSDIILDKGYYAIALLTDSAAYRSYIATLGENIYNGGEEEFIATQPYLPGLLFSSSNAMAWTAHQNSDLTFVLYAKTYDNKVLYRRGVEIEFHRISVTDFNAFMLNTTSIIPNGTSISWFYSVDGSSYSQFEPNNIIDTGSLSRNLWLRAVLRSSSEFVTPILNRAASSVILFKPNDYGSYISRGIELDASETFNHVDVYFTIPRDQAVDLVEPWIAYSSDEFGNDKWVQVPYKSKEDVSYWFTRCKYSLDIDQAVTYYRIRLNMKNNNTTKAYRLMSIFSEV